MLIYSNGKFVCLSLVQLKLRGKRSVDIPVRQRQSGEQNARSSITGQECPASAKARKCRFNNWATLRF